jgi:hypothetical protein
MNAHRLRLAGLGSLCVLVCAVLLCGSSAFAARGHVFAGTFGEPCSSEPCGKGQFKEAGQVVVDDASGDVYVIDRGDDRVEWFSSSGQYLGQFDGSGSFEVGGKVETGVAAGEGGQPGERSTGRFTRPSGITVDNACALHSPMLTEATTPTCHEFDPSAGDVYVLDGTGGQIGEHEVVDKFSATGEYVGQLAGTPSEQFDQLEGVSVDSTGLVWVYRKVEADGEIYSFSDADSNVLSSERSVPRGSFGGYFNAPPSFSVDAHGTFDYFYLSASLREEAFRYTSSGKGIELIDGKSSTEESGVKAATEAAIGNSEVASDNAPIGREPVYASALDPVTHEFYTSSLENYVTRFSEKLGIVEQFGAGHLTKGTEGFGATGANGIGVDPSSGVVFVSDSLADVVDVFSLEPPGEPRIAAQAAVSAVTSGSATFTASIDPEGIASEYRFEFGPTDSYGESVPLPDGVVGSGFEVAEVVNHVQDLTAGTVYHYRVVAHNGDGTVYGEDRTFTTQSLVSELGLADGRVYEMVTPAQKRGALFLGPDNNFGGNALSGQASADGRAIMDLASNPVEEGPEGNALSVAVLSTRGSSGWSSQTIAPPHREATFISFGLGGEYRFFSEDLSRAIVSPYGPFYPLAAGASESTPYLRTDFVSGDPEEHCSTDCFLPLVTAANTQPGAVFGEALPNGACSKPICGPWFIDATPDLSHVVLSSPAQLTSRPTPEGGMYMWSGGRLQLISEPPEGQTGGLRLAGAETGLGVKFGTSFAQGEFGARHAISNDGMRVILKGQEGLYLRDLTSGELVRLDAAQGGSAVSLEPSFMTASTDDSRIFFIDGAGLTAESSAGGRDLYEYDLNAPAGHRLTDLTVDEHAGAAANVKSVLGASNDGSYVYFVAEGALTANATVGECVNHNLLRPEECNIYVRHDGVTQLVAGGWEAELAVKPGPELEENSRVAPGGGWLAFMSSRNLTGYDTRDAASGQPDVEVYLYDANAARLVCASCNPTGARPVGVELGNLAAILVGGSLGESVWTAANVVPWTQMNEGEERYQPRYLSDSGRLFFNSSDALVPQDVNGTEDVYEYEPVAVGSCNASSVTFGPRSDGCVSLVSSGSSAEESAFMDASETGSDAFFLTSSKLGSQDFDNALDVYDAHECSVSVPCYPVPSAVPPVCVTGDACKAAATPQPGIFGPAPSEAFEGVGNVSNTGSDVKSRSVTRARRLAGALRACRKERGKRRRTVCERRARRRFGSAATSRTSAKRKGGR